MGTARGFVIVAAGLFAFTMTGMPLPSEASGGSLATSPTSTPETRSVCDNPETGWKLEKLNGKVKSLREDEIEYRYGPRKKELTRQVTFGATGEYIRDDQRRYFQATDYTKIPKPMFVFDKDCRVLERQDPKRPDRMAGATRSTFSYTPSGTLKESATYDSEGRLLRKSVATLDERDRVVETNDSIQEHPEHYNPKRYDVYRYTRSLYKVDDAGNQVEEISYDWTGKLYATYKRAYDSARRLTRELRLDHKDRPIRLVIYKFNGTGMLVEELNYDSSGYSGLDELIPGTLDSGFGKFQAGYRTTYEFDMSSNWIKKTEFDLSENKTSRVTSRAILYY